jgi:DNA-binding MarR family transcriptional regulator
VAEHGIQRPEFATLFCTAHLAGATASDVVALTGIPKNSISRAVARLAGDGLIEREQHEDDGRKAYDALLPQFMARQERMLAVLSPAELKEFDRLLDKLVERDDDWATDF